jgi:hypothetical protein
MAGRFEPRASPMAGGRFWRIGRTETGEWIVERTALDQLGNEVRELSAVYRSRPRAEQAIIHAMREETLWGATRP